VPSRHKARQHPPLAPAARVQRSPVGVPPPVEKRGSCASPDPFPQAEKTGCTRNHDAHRSPRAHARRPRHRRRRAARARRRAGPGGAREARRLHPQPRRRRGEAAAPQGGVSVAVRLADRSPPLLSRLGVPAGHRRSPLSSHARGRRLPPRGAAQPHQALLPQGFARPRELPRPPGARGVDDRARGRDPRRPASPGRCRSGAA